MPRRNGITTRQEAFCLAYAESGNGSHSARLAGYAAGSANVEASRLLARPDVAHRIAELRADAARRRRLKTEALWDKLDQICEAALQWNRFSAANRTVELQARLTGLFPDQQAAAVLAVLEEELATLPHGALDQEEAAAAPDRSPAALAAPPSDAPGEC